MKELRRAAEGIASLEEYALKSSPLNKIHPCAKLLVSAVYIVCAASFPRLELSGLAASALYPAILLPLSNIPLRGLAKRIVPILPFALMGGIANIFFMREPVLRLGTIVISEGLISCAVILLKAVFCAASALILIGSTSFYAICAELRRFRVPAAFCVQLLLLYRYIAVLLEEASAMSAAYLLRSGEKAVKMKDMGAFIGRLFLRSMDKAGKVYNAMKCRGWTRAFYFSRRKMTAIDYFYCAVMCGLSVFLRFFNISIFWGRLFYA